MKTVYISFLVVILFVLAISTDAKTEEATDCPTFCTFDYKPVCGYNGKCYRTYGNACTLKVERCSKEKKNDVNAVEMDLCVKALAKSNPDVIACDEEH